MSHTVKMEHRTARVLNILNSIAEAISGSSSENLIREAYDWKKGKSPEEVEKIEKKITAGRGKLQAKKRRRSIRGKLSRLAARKAKEAKEIKKTPPPRPPRKRWRDIDPEAEAARLHPHAPKKREAAKSRLQDVADKRAELARRRRGVTPAVGKLARIRKKHHTLRDREHDVDKGYDPDEGRPKSKKKGHHIDSSGKEVHSSGKKDNKKFANATTFSDSDDDAMLHTDKSKDGSRASADDNEFVFHGNLKKDPRQKWYRVSKDGGYASAMASLGKVYQKSPDMKNKVMAKVQSTGFVDAKGKQINVKPTGSLHNERGACMKNKTGGLTASGKLLKKHNPKEFYRLCKGPHGPSGTPDRNEYERGFDPRHDDAHKVRKLHKAAEAGKADKPGKNIHQHLAAKPGRRADKRQFVRSVD